MMLDFLVGFIRDLSWPGLVCLAWAGVCFTAGCLMVGFALV